MDDRREANYRGLHTQCCYGLYCFFRSDAGKSGGGGLRILFRCKLTRNAGNSGARGNDKGTIRARESGAKGLDRPAIDLATRRPVCEVVDEGSMDYTIAHRCSKTKAFLIFQITPVYLDAR